MANRHFELAFGHLAQIKQAPVDINQTIEYGMALNLDAVTKKLQELLAADVLIHGIAGTAMTTGGTVNASNVIAYYPATPENSFQGFTDDAAAIAALAADKLFDFVEAANGEHRFDIGSAVTNVFKLVRKSNIDDRTALSDRIIARVALSSY